MYILEVLIKRPALVEAYIVVPIPGGVLIRRTLVEVYVEIQLQVVLLDEEPVFFDQLTAGEDVLDLEPPDRISLSRLAERELRP